MTVPAAGLYALLCQHFVRDSLTTKGEGAYGNQEER